MCSLRVRGPAGATVGVTVWRDAGLGRSGVKELRKRAKAAGVAEDTLE
eukprot:COSAG02_NODE_46937_length_345_cov_0.605691_2_plen_47_part_01